MLSNGQLIWLGSVLWFLFMVLGICWLLLRPKGILKTIGAIMFSVAMLVLELLFYT